MKINSTFQVSVFLMAVLMFSTPFITIAEEGSVVAEATAAAIADAEKNVNKTSWFIIGCCLTRGGVIASTVGTPPVPIERLAGKSPEYMIVYISNYQSHGREIRRRSATKGFLLGAIIIGVSTIASSLSVGNN